MNDSTLPNEPQGAPSGGFFQWIRNLGIVRDSGDRWFAGVASGIAKKANIDPLIVRGIFVVLAVLGGPGLLLYLFGWLFLPDRTGKIHVEDLMRGRSTPGITIGAIIVAVWVIAGLFFGRSLSIWNWDVWGALGLPGWLTGTFLWVFWVSVVVAVAYIIHRMVLKHGTAQRAASPTAPDPVQAFTQQAEHWGENFSEKAEQWGEDFSHKADEWGRGVSEQTTAWSAQYAERHQHTQMPRGQQIITIACAMLAAGGAIWAFQTNNPLDLALPWDAAGPILASLIAATVVLALSIIIAGVRGKRTGGIGFLGFLAIAALLVTAVFPWGSRYFLFGNHEIGSESPGVFSVAGQLHADLTTFDNDAHAEDLVITQLFGNVDVLLPETRPTTVHVHLAAGRIIESRTESNRSSGDVTLTSGVFSQRSFTFNEDSKRTPVTITVNLGAGNVTLTPSEKESSRGNARLIFTLNSASNNAPNSAANTGDPMNDTNEPPVPPAQADQPSGPTPTPAAPAPAPATSRLRTWPIVWGTLMLAFCAWVAQRTLFPESIAPGVWISAIVLGLGFLLLVVGIVVATRGRAPRHQ